MDEAKTEQKPAGNSKLLVVVVALNTVVAGGALASSLLQAKGHAAAAPAAAEHDAKAAEGEAAGGKEKAEGGHEGAAAKAEEPARPVARIDNLVVRLRNPEMDRFARVTIDVELGRAADLGAFQSNVPRVRDAAITTIADLTAEQLAGSIGMGKLKADLMQRIAGVLPGASVTAVYLSDFVVQ